jgi:hypothetical protein
MGHLFAVSVYTIQEQIEHKYPDLEFTKFAFLCFVDYEYQRIFSRPIMLCDIWACVCIVYICDKFQAFRVCCVCC